MLNLQASSSSFSSQCKLRALLAWQVNSQVPARQKHRTQLCNSKLKTEEVNFENEKPSIY